jgi:DNA repair exonuclease SbcCD ATPase subunit
MPEENEEKVEDFISLWKKKITTENQSSVIGESLNKIESLQKENEDLRKKIAANINLITRSEEILKNVVAEKEKLKVEKEEAVTEISIKVNELQVENSELSNKVKSMIKLLLEKDEEIQTKDSLMSDLQKTRFSTSGPTTPLNSALIEELQSDLNRRKSNATNLESKISELSEEINSLNKQLIEKMKNEPVDFVIQAEPPKPLEPPVIKPLPPEPSSSPLETLCKDLQSDLTKYKRVIEKITKEKSQLKNALEEKGFQFSPQELESLKLENESLKKDLEEIQSSLEVKKIEATQIATQNVEQKIADLESKIREKEDIIADLKLSQIAPTTTSAGSMPELVENLQKNINKLKSIITEKDNIISELNKQINQM